MKVINLYWWSEIFIQKKSKENYGDLLGAYLVEKISGTKVTWFNPKKRRLPFVKQTVYATIGSILAHVKKDWIVWGSGIISGDTKVAEAKFLAVRGPQTRKHLVAMGYSVPEVYGDPGLLLPNYYAPKSIIKQYKIGIIPHYNDYKQVYELYKNDDKIKVIDLMTNNIEFTTDEILSCKQIISSSLHGIIMAHAYEIPAVWIQFSDKVFGDGIKYQDYFESVGIAHYVPEIITKQMTVEDCENYISGLVSLPEKERLESLRKGLMAVCPFK